MEIKTTVFCGQFDLEGATGDQATSDMVFSILPTLVKDHSFLIYAHQPVAFDDEGNFEISVSWNSEALPEGSVDNFIDEKDMMYSLLCDYTNTMSVLIGAPE